MGNVLLMDILLTYLCVRSIKTLYIYCSAKERFCFVISVLSVHLLSGSYKDSTSGGSKRIPKLAVDRPVRRILQVYDCTHAR